MNELLKINYDNERPTVSGRELHKALEINTRYNDWFQRMCEYGFSEGKDFYSFLSGSTGGRPAEDHQLTIPMAKEIAMLQRNEKGKQIRQYFIQIREDEMSGFDRDFYAEHENQIDYAQANQDDDYESADAAYDSLEEEAYVNGYATTDFGWGYRYGIC